MSNVSNLQLINQEEAFNLCRLYTNIGQNILLLGQKGTGKTHIAMQAALENGFKISYINLSVLDRGDLLGFPKLNDNEDVVTYKSPYYLPLLKEGQKSDHILLLDEVDKADSTVWAPLLEILQFKTINGKKLNAVAAIMTGNLINEGAYSNQISTALLDRAAKYQLHFDLFKWLEWAKKNQVHDLITAFLESNQDLACGPIDGGSLIATPSPRGWTMASESIIQAKRHKVTDIDTITHIIAGFVGESASIRFRIWYDYYRQFESFISALVETGTCGIEYNKLGPTEQLVFCVGSSYATKMKIMASNKKQRLKYIENLCRFFTDNRVAKEIQLNAINNAFNGEMITKYGLYQSKPFFELVGKLQENLKIK